MSRIRRLFQLGRRGPGVDDAVDWEIAHHLEERADELAARGMPRDEALAAARASFGNLDRVRAEMREISRGTERRLAWRERTEALGQDLRHALRRLRRTPGFTAVAIVVLGLGIGVNTALFTALEAALLRRPPYPDAERLVTVDLLMSQTPGAPGDTLVWSYPKFQAMRERMRSVEPIAGYAPRPATLTGLGPAARVEVEYVSPAYFSLLGVRPVLGRVFTPGEDPPAPGAVVVLGHSFWMSRFGGDPGAVGRTVTLNGAALQVVGVLPPGFAGITGGAEVWIPLAGVAATGSPRQLQTAQAHWMQALGRLRPGATLAQAREEAATLGAALDEAFPPPAGMGGQGVAMVPFLSARVNPVARLAVTAAAIGGALLLLIACGNVAGLLLARASARRTDAAVRAALGAGRGRLARESLLESLLLSSAGGALGILLALAGQRAVSHAVRYALDTSGTRDIQFVNPDALAVDGTVLALGVALAILTGLLFGWLPARASSRPDLTRDLRAGGGGSIGGRRRESAGAGRGVLVAGQLALTLVLLAGAGLMAASFARLSAVPVGFTHTRVLAFNMSRPAGVGSSEEADLAFEEALLERLAAIPGVRSVGVAPCAPLTSPCEITGLRRVDDRPEANAGQMSSIVTYPVSDGYFRTLGIPVRRGRVFGTGDVAGGPPVAVINETAARELFPGVSPLGHRIAVTHSLTEEAMAEIVGVVGDVRDGALEEPVLPAVYFSRRQAPSSYGAVFLRTSGDPYAALPAARREVAALDPDLPLSKVTTLAELEALATARTRIVLGLTAAFALTGLLLSAVGLYGLVSYAVVRRTRELGLRVALGASARDVLRLVMRPPAVLAAAGAAAGIVGALLLTRYAEALLFGVRPSDPRVLAVATLVLLGVAVAAALIPARRAARVNPADALRSP